MPDADGRIRGIQISGKAADAWERVFGEREKRFLEDAQARRCPRYPNPCYCTGQCRVPPSERVR